MMCIPTATVACVATGKPLILSKLAMQLSASGAKSLLLGLQPSKVPCAAGADWSIFNPPASWLRREVAQLYGNNDMQTGRPIFLKMAGALLIYPLYVVQVSLIYVSLS